MRIKEFFENLKNKFLGKQTFSDKIRKILKKPHNTWEEKYSEYINLYRDYFKHDLISDAVFYTYQDYYEFFMVEEGVRHEFKYQQFYNGTYTCLAYDTLYELFDISRQFVDKGMDPKNLPVDDKNFFDGLMLLGEKCHFPINHDFGLSSEILGKTSEFRPHIDQFLDTFAKPIVENENGFPDASEIFEL